MSKRAAFTWSSTTLPAKAGHWWYRETPNHEESVVLVFMEPGEREWSYRYGSRANDVNWVANTFGHQWAGPIPLPADEVEAAPVSPYDDGIEVKRSRR